MQAMGSNPACFLLLQSEQVYEKLRRGQERSKKPKLPALFGMKRVITFEYIFGRPTTSKSIC